MKCSKLNCVSEYYEFRVVRTWEEASNWLGQKSVMEVILPPTPEVDYIHNPKLETVEFVCYVASVLSIWFGFSIFTLYSQAKVMFEKWRNRNIIDIDIRENIHSEITKQFRNFSQQMERRVRLEINAALCNIKSNQSIASGKKTFQL